MLCMKDTRLNKVAVSWPENCKPQEYGKADRHENQPLRQRTYSSLLSRVRRFTKALKLLYLPTEQATSSDQVEFCKAGGSNYYPAVVE